MTLLAKTTYQAPSAVRQGPSPPRRIRLHLLSGRSIPSGDPMVVTTVLSSHVCQYVP